MKYLGTQISEDGATLWRNNGGWVERLEIYASSEWKDAKLLEATPEGLRKFCEEGGFGYLPPRATRIIPRRMSGTGGIHSVSSDICDREIVFAPGCVFAVINSSYYGGRGYTTHTTARAAARRSKKNDYSHNIVDIIGNRYDADPCGNLVMLPTHSELFNQI